MRCLKCGSDRAYSSRPRCSLNSAGIAVHPLTQSVHAMALPTSRPNNLLRFTRTLTGNAVAGSSKSSSTVSEMRITRGSNVCATRTAASRSVGFLPKCRQSHVRQRANAPRMSRTRWSKLGSCDVSTSIRGSMPRGPRRESFRRLARTSPYDAPESRCPG